MVVLVWSLTDCANADLIVQGFGSGDQYESPMYIRYVSAWPRGPIRCVLCAPFESGGSGLVYLHADWLRLKPGY